MQGEIWQALCAHFHQPFQCVGIEEQTLWVREQLRPPSLVVLGESHGRRRRTVPQLLPAFLAVLKKAPRAELITL